MENFMKKDIHPAYHPITIVMTDGTRYESRSTYGKSGDVLQLDVDPKTHPAWVGGVNLRKTGQMEKFNNKFSAFAVAAKSAGEKAAEVAKANPGSVKPTVKKEEKKPAKK